MEDRMSKISDESIWRMRVLSTSMPEYVGELVRCKDCAHHDEGFTAASGAMMTSAPRQRRGRTSDDDVP